MRMLIAALATLVLSLSAHPGSSAQKSLESTSYGKLPLSFEANRGQTAPEVKFTARGRGYSLFLTGTEAVLAFNRQPAEASSGSSHADRVRMKIARANSSIEPAGENQLPGTANYFLGNDPTKWRTRIPTYAKVRYNGIYPGIDLVYYGNQRQLEYDFTVAPGADPRRIRLQFAGARGLRITPQGDLAVKATNGQIAFQKPQIYQEIAHSRQPVRGRFRLLGNRSVGFSLGAYDHAAPLVIDPVLVYSTYLGGTGGDGASGIAVDASGSAYVAGSTGSADFPVTDGAFQTTFKSETGFGNGPSISAFVTKLDPTGSYLLYSTYLGGSAYDYASAIAVDSSGSAYLTGVAGSFDFPVTTGAFQVSPVSNICGCGLGTGFITKLNPTGTALVYSTFLGGNYSDWGSGIAIDSDGNAFVTGSTQSEDFPVTPGAFQTEWHAGGIPPFYWEAFITKMNPTGTALVYSTFLSGSTPPYYDDGVIGADDPTSIAVDSHGDAFIVGSTDSTDFPVTKNAFQATNETPGPPNPPWYSGPLAGWTGYLTKLNPTGTGLVYSTYLGGKEEEYITAITVDSAGDAYITGNGTAESIAATTGAFLRTGQGAFVTKMNPAGNGLIYSTLLGGDPFTAGTALAIDSAGNATLTGSTYSTDFPVTTQTFQSSKRSTGRIEIGFVTRMNATGSALLYSTYLGGTGWSDPSGNPSSLGDSPSAVALDPSGNAYIAGTTYSSDFPVTPDAFQKANHEPPGNPTVFVTKLNLSVGPSTLATTTKLTASANPAGQGSRLYVYASVVPAFGSNPPSGRIVFSADGTPVSNVPLDSAGHAYYLSDSLGLGAHTFSAKYLGNSTWVSSGATLSETIELPLAATPTVSPVAGLYDALVPVTLTDATEGATIHYTLNGRTPTAASPVYAKPIEVGQPTTVKAIAVASGFSSSTVATAIYTIKLPTVPPVLWPPSGTYDKPITVKSPSDAFPGIVIYYTTSGQTPTTNSAKYTTAGISVSKTQTIKAIAVAPGHSVSPVASATYTIK